MGPVWRVEMFGTLTAKSHDLTVSRFRTKRVAVLLAFLALHRNRQHLRDELGEMLWPESELQVSRRNLRQALLSLRHALEPPPLPSGAVLQVRQSALQLNPELLTTDVSEFEDLIERARETRSSEERFESLKRAIALYKGELLPGFDELWVLNERLRMEDLYIYSLGRLIEECEKLGRTDEAIQYLRLALAKDPLTEEWHVALMRQYLEAGRPGSALKQYEELEKMLREQLHCEPDDEAQELAARARRDVGGVSEAPAKVMPVPIDAEPTSKELIRLPVQLTRLFGRKAEIEAIVAHFEAETSRLMTIVGPAGTGKTRLSVEVGTALTDWNIWFVPLADIDDASLLLDRVLETVKPQKRGRGSALDQIREALPEGRSLLILDNFEHILEEGANAVRELLEAIPQVFCLVTSRQALKLEGEHEFPLQPLPIPDPGYYETAEQLASLAQYPSIQMFVDRCQAIRPDVQLTPNNARHFAAICAKLEGIPLAIEIAAGLSNSFAPAQMVKHLENRLAVLTSRRRDIAPRHRSLRVAIDYGYGFLSPKLQRFFAALSVFRGGFTVEAARAVCSEDSSSKSCLGTILDLQERSLLRAEQDLGEGAELRFRMLEIFREYAEECLDEAEHRNLKGRHARYYLSTPMPEGAEERAKLHIRIESDYDNYIAALEHLFQNREIESCVRLLAILSTIWDIRGTKSIEENYIRQISRLPEMEKVEPALRIQLLRMLGTTYLRDSEFKAAYRACSDALEVARTTGSDELIASCYYGMALCAGYMGEADRCLELCAKVLEHAPETDGVLLERTYVSIGSAHWSRDELQEAETAFTRAREVSQAFRGGEPDALILSHLSGVCLDQGRLDEAMKLAGEGIRISRRLRNEISLSACLSQVGRYHRYKGSLAAAVATSHEALQKGRDLAILMLGLEAIRGHALILAEMNESETAVTLIAATQGLDTMEKVSERRESHHALDRFRSELPQETYERAWARGLAMDIDEAFRLALAFK